jgi:hypothetical protein
VERNVCVVTVSVRPLIFGAGDFAVVANVTPPTSAAATTAKPIRFVRFFIPTTVRSRGEKMLHQ